MKYYYDNEAEKYISEEELKKDYILYGDPESETFPQFVNSCMSYNNGCLDTLKQRKKELCDMLWITYDDEDDTEYMWIIEELNYIDTLL